MKIEMNEVLKQIKPYIKIHSKYNNIFELVDNGVVRHLSEIKVFPYQRSNEMNFRMLEYLSNNKNTIDITYEMIFSSCISKYEDYSIIIFPHMVCLAIMSTYNRRNCCLINLCDTEDDIIILYDESSININHLYIDKESLSDVSLKGFRIKKTNINSFNYFSNQKYEFLLTFLYVFYFNTLMRHSNTSMISETDNLSDKDLLNFIKLLRNLLSLHRLEESSSFKYLNDEKNNDHLFKQTKYSNQKLDIIANTIKNNF